MSNGQDPRDTDRQQSERLQLVESKINMERAKEIGIAIGGLTANDMSQVFEFAKGMSLSGPMVPAFCRGQPWTCFGIVLQAIELKMSPYSLARMAYEVENQKTHEKTVAYMSQVWHATIESRQVLTERLKVRYEGEGDDMVCIVSGMFKGEKEPREWKSPKLGLRKPKPQKRTNNRSGEEYETTPGSPLWQTKPMVQLFYDTSRDWARIYCPDVIMGIYDAEEMDEAGFEPTSSPPTNDDGGLSQRLSESALRSAGFNPAYAAQAIDGEPMAADTIPHAPEAAVAPVALTPQPEGAGGDGSATEAEPSPPPSDDAPPPNGAGQLLASEEVEATPVPETDESRPRPSQRRPRPTRPDGDNPRLV